MADIPAGTGLGSSGSFTTALLKALHAHNKNLVHPQQLAEQACEIEIEKLGEPIGKQDQYIAAYGGVTCFNFRKDGSVDAEPLAVSEETLYNLEDSLLLFFTGYSRSASAILKDQDVKTKKNDEDMVANMNMVKELGLRSKVALEAGNLARFGEIMHEHWGKQAQALGRHDQSDIDSWYNLAMANGAVGGKLIGAGGGGFLMFMADDKEKLRHAMRGAGLTEVRFRFDFEGAKLVAN